MLIDLKNIEKLPPDQRARLEETLKMYPGVMMQNKAATSRTLNTPAYQEAAAEAPQDHMFTAPIMTPPDEPEDLSFADAPPPPPPMRKPVAHASAKIDPVEGRSPYAMEAENQETAEKKFVPPKPKPKAEFSHMGKEHPIITKMKATLGMAGTETLPSLDIGGTVYTLDRVNREQILKATSLAKSNSDTEITLRGNLENAILAYAVKSMDQVPVVEVFQIPAEGKDEKGKPVALKREARDDMAAEAFYLFLIDAPNELTQALASFYESEFPTISLLDKHKTVAYCPEENCPHKRIMERSMEMYCPLHGRKLTKEENLPNPF